MERIFKKLTIFLSYLLIISTVLLIFSIPPYIKSDKSLNFFSTNQIAENIKNLELNMTSIIYVKNSDDKWEEYQRLHGNENRIWIGIDNVPKNLKDAFVAIEDQDFYTHKGVDWTRTLGAVGNFLFSYSDVEFGGSTITQQLIKNVTMDNGRNAYRKFREIVRATLIEQKLEKTQILEAYLNTIALGNGICGVQVASNYYFNKDVSELSLVESAALAAITKNPSKFNLITGMDENKIRRNTVLSKMLELGFINEEEYKSAYDKDISLDTSQEDNYEAEINNYFVDALIEQVIADLAEKYECDESLASTMLYNGGYKIYSTMNPTIQSHMEGIYSNTDKYFKLQGVDFNGNPVNVQSAMTIMDYTGHIVGLVGGVGEKTVNRGLNRATSSPRQPGSTMKPIGVYTLAIENDIVHYSSKVKDQPIDNYYPDGKKGPKEWYGYYKGTITVDYAIRKSANTIPVILLKELGIQKSYDFLTNKLHCSYLTETDKNLASLALGGCSYGLTTTESAGAYAIFGNQGVYHKPTTYHKIVKTNGDVELEYDTTGEQVISPATATIMNHLLQGVVYGGEGTGRGISSYSSMKAYAKTGTSSESNDLWMVAGTPYYVGSVWYGFDKQQEIKSTSGAATVWRDVMKLVHKGLPKKDFVDSEDVYKKGSGYYKKGSTPDNVVYQSSSEDESSSSSSTESASSSSSVTSSADTSSETSTSSSAGTTSSKPDTSSSVSSSGTSSNSTPQSAPTESTPSSQTPSIPTPSTSKPSAQPPESKPTQTEKPDNTDSSSVSSVAPPSKPEEPPVESNSGTSSVASDNSPTE